MAVALPMAFTTAALVIRVVMPFAAATLMFSGFVAAAAASLTVGVGMAVVMFVAVAVSVAATATARCLGGHGKGRRRFQRTCAK